MKHQHPMLIAACLLASSAHSADIGFSFSDDPSANLFGRTHVDIPVTGILYGLADDGNNQLPTSIRFTSNVDFVGITDFLITPIENNFVAAGGGFSLTGGVVMSADYTLNFDDPVTGGKQLNLNRTTLNLLMWNGGTGPFTVSGNTGGFAGATYTTVAAVPEPASVALMLAGLLVVGTAAGKRQSSASAIASRST